MQKTPPGVIEMLKIKGLGPKKISTVWKEMEIESIGELMYACNENRLLLYKGFGEKTQDNIRETISFYLKSRGSFLFAEVEAYAHQIQKNLKESFPQHLISLTGAFRRQLEIIVQPEWICSIPLTDLGSHLKTQAFTLQKSSGNQVIATGTENVPLKFHSAPPESFYSSLFAGSASEAFLDAWKARFAPLESPASEEIIFQQAGVPFIPAAYREDPALLDKARSPFTPLIHASDIKGIIHSHSNWSDGLQTIEKLAEACIEQGFEYLVISDHSKSAFYANGLSEDRIREQHLYIDELNRRLAPFHIFKSIECDILYDGNLDYSDQTLSSFDLVIASVHSNLKMNAEKAMSRLLRAIENPHTRILGHPTGRLLLSRPGYPVDHKTLIDSCAVHGVVIELNAHPRRLDLDWRWIDYALQKNVMISIDPDAHSIAGFHDVHYGVLAAQKGGLRKEQNLSSFSLEQMQEFVRRGS
jgi:DNA polymerase (family 10)